MAESIRRRVEQHLVKREIQAFVEQMFELFAGPPAGRLLVPTLAELAGRPRQLEQLVAELQNRKARRR